MSIVGKMAEFSTSLNSKVMKTFKMGGIHPPEYKCLAEHKAIENLPAPELLYIPVSQHTGAPAKIIVNVGDAVDKGQLIAEAGGYVSANIHSPVSGKIKEIKKIQNLLGSLVDHIVIENDKAERWAAGMNQPRLWEALSAEELRGIVAEAGIVGMGGAAFPTHVKLNPPKEKPIDTLVINGAECEPYLTCDHRLMIERTTGIAAGIIILKKILGAPKVIIGIESNKIDAYNKIKASFTGDDGVDVFLLKVKYPEGAEKQLINAVLRREVLSGGLPMDVGVVVQNAATCFAVFEAVTINKPLIERVVTVSGDGVERPANYQVRIGTPIKHLLDASRIKKSVKRMIAGGPMMGVSFFNVDLPVQKGTSGIVVMSEYHDYLERECIRCGRCISVCPMGIEPTALASAVKNKQVGEYKGLNCMDCMECGSCTFVCPARIPIVQYIKEAKAEVVASRSSNV